MASSVVDLETGEVLKEPEFVKLYIKEVCSIRGLNSSQTKIFQFMLSEMNWHNEVCYGTTSKQRFLDAHNMKNQTFNNNITALIDSGLIAREGKGAFKVNPKYASKVEWAKVKKITWVTEYTEKGKHEKVDVFFNDEAYFETVQQKYTATEPEPAPPPKAKAKPKAKKTTHTAYELEVFEHWVMRMGKSKNAKLTGKRLARLKDRLKDGYEVDYIKQAVDGCARSPHHMGQNDQGTVYDDLELICRDGAKLEQFAESAGKVTPFRKDAPKTIDQFFEENEAQAQRVLNSGLLDDIL